MEAEIGDLGGGLQERRDSPAMILTCPECATSYFVDDARIPPSGRTVKCTNCGARWHSADQSSAPPSEDPELFDDPVVDETPVVAEMEAPAPAEPEAAPVDDDLIVSGPAPKATPARSTPRAKAKSAPPTALIGLVAALVLLGVLAGAAALLRDQVTAKVPQAAAAYAAIGLPADTLGLAIEGVKAQPAFLSGRPVINVTGVVRNLRAKGAESPSIRVEMLGSKGSSLATRIVRPLEPHVPGKARRHFALAIPDPPKGVQQLALTFETAAGKAPPAVHARTAPAAEPAHPPEPADDAPHG
jgi:predicted Zn finger-like uncharacterized protein